MCTYFFFALNFFRGGLLVAEVEAAPVPPTLLVVLFSRDRPVTVGDVSSYSRGFSGCVLRGFFAEEVLFAAVLSPATSAWTTNRQSNVEQL